MKFTTEIRQDENLWYYQVEFPGYNKTEAKYIVRKFPNEGVVDYIIGFKPTLEEAEYRLNEILESIKKYSEEYNSKKIGERTKKRWYKL